MGWVLTSDGVWWYHPPSANDTPQETLAMQGRRTTYTPSTLDKLTRDPKQSDPKHAVSPFDLHTDIDVLTRGWLATRPLMEVAAPVADRFLSAAGRRKHALRVREERSNESRIVAEVRPHTLLRVLETYELTDGSTRAFVVLHRSRRPLGWLTAATTDGEALIHMYARPIYELVGSAAKVRRGS